MALGSSSLDHVGLPVELGRFLPAALLVGGARQQAQLRGLGAKRLRRAR